jgi:3-mercaptopropionate dioxygenase
MMLLTPPRHLTPELAALVTVIRSAVTANAGWQQTARLVAEQLRRHLPTPAALAQAQRADGADSGRSRLLHAEPDGTFSILALVWRPHQVTRIHDHITWCVFGVVQGVEHEELFTLDDHADHLVPAGQNTNRVGEVSGFAPPGDIHLIRNAGEDTAISIHIYGTDISRVGSSVRRYYDLPVRPA